MSIRIRNSPEVKELNIPEDKIKELQQIMNSSTLSPYRKKVMIKEKSGGIGPCSICGFLLPEVELRTQIGDSVLEPAVRIERFCANCLKTVFERTKEEGEDVAEYYGCVKGKGMELEKNN